MDDIQAASSQQFGKQSHRYARGHILENIEDVQRALTHVSLPATARVLDVACGAGYTGLHLARLGHEVTFSDLTPAMLQRAEEKAQAEGLAGEFRCHAAEELPYDDRCFDLVTCRVAPHHFSSPEAFIQESARVLRPGGSFLLIDGTVPDGEPAAEAWMHEVEKRRDPSHQRLLTPGTWMLFCEAAGLRVRWHAVERRQQPDLNWYFETANTPVENRAAVLRLIDTAPKAARQLFAITKEGDTVSWWWSMLSLVAEAS